MFDKNFGIFLGILTGITLLLLPVVNYYFQKRGREYADNFLENIPKEYNKQIKANAYGYLIRRSLWGLFFLSGFIFNLPAILTKGFNWLSLITLLLGIGCIVWGIWGCKMEMKRVKPLK